MLAAVAYFRHLKCFSKQKTAAQRYHNLLFVCKFINERHRQINNSCWLQWWHYNDMCGV